MSENFDDDDVSRSEAGKAIDRCVLQMERNNHYLKRKVAELEQAFNKEGASGKLAEKLSETSSLASTAKIASEKTDENIRHLAKKLDDNENRLEVVIEKIREHGNTLTELHNSQAKVLSHVMLGRDAFRDSLSSIGIRVSELEDGASKYDENIRHLAKELDDNENRIVSLGGRISKLEAAHDNQENRARVSALAEQFAVLSRTVSDNAERNAATFTRLNRRIDTLERIVVDGLGALAARLEAMEALGGARYVVQASKKTPRRKRGKK